MDPKAVHDQRDWYEFIAVEPPPGPALEASLLETTIDKEREIAHNCKSQLRRMEVHDGRLEDFTD